MTSDPELGRNIVVFVHGLFSDAGTWESMLACVKADNSLDGIDTRTFDYPSPKFSLNPLRKIPSIDEIAGGLDTYLRLTTGVDDRVLLIGHSQGGLVIQRYLHRSLHAGRARNIRNIRGAVFFACPNFGSQMFLALRKAGGLFWRHRQERALRGLDSEIAEAMSTAIHHVQYAPRDNDYSHRVALSFYAGLSDNIVNRGSAHGVHLDIGDLPGDHFSIIQPAGVGDLRYLALRSSIVTAFGSNVSDPASKDPRTSTLGIVALRVVGDNQVSVADLPGSDGLEGTVLEELEFLEFVVVNHSAETRVIHRLVMKVEDAGLFEVGHAMGGFIRSTARYDLELPSVPEFSKGSDTVERDLNQSIKGHGTDRFSIRVGARHGNLLPGLYRISLHLIDDSGTLHAGRAVVSSPVASPHYLDVDHGEIGPAAVSANAATVLRIRDSGTATSHEFGHLAELASLVVTRKN